MLSTRWKNVGWQGGTSMSAERNKALVRRFLEAHAKGDLDTVDEMLAPDFVDHNLIPGQRPGREGYLRALTEFHAAYSHTRYVIEKQLAEGEEVVTTFAVSSTHDRGEWMGLVPTGKEFKALHILIHRIVGGKITDEWNPASNLAELAQQRLEQVRIERERIEQELKVARSIQHASLPEELPDLEGWRIAAYYGPAREVGGDFYDFFELEDGRLGLVVGDATGHGMPAALVMATARSMLRAVAQASESPGEVLRMANDPLFTDIPPNMFVTCFYAILDPKSGRLVYANAGHDLPYLHRGGDAEELRARGMPLGLMLGMSYEEQEVTLEAGESALFYSDGLVEAHDLQRREMFGFPRLQVLVAEHDDEERSLVTLLLEELYSFTGEGWEQEDDITLVTLRRAAVRS